MKKVLISLVAMMFFCVPMVFALSIDSDDPSYLGSINPGSPATGPAEIGYVNKLISMTAPSVDSTEPWASGFRIYTRTDNDFGFEFPSLDLPTAISAFTVGSDPRNVSLVGLGADYILGKYGNISYVWYVGNLIEFSIPDDIKNGLSHYTLFNSKQVPEPTTLLLFGAGLAGLAVYRRRSSK